MFISNRVRVNVALNAVVLRETVTYRKYIVRPQLSSNPAKMASSSSSYQESGYEKDTNLQRGQEAAS